MFCIIDSFIVDEYIHIAKEKHGYNMEQVCTQDLDFFFFMNTSFCMFFLSELSEMLQVVTLSYATNYLCLCAELTLYVQL